MRQASCKEVEESEFHRTFEEPYFYPGLSEEQNKPSEEQNKPSEWIGDTQAPLNSLEQRYVEVLGRPLTQTERAILRINGDLQICGVPLARRKLLKLRKLY